MRNLQLSVVVCSLIVGGCVEAPDEIGVAEAPILGGTGGYVGQFPTVVAIANRGLCTGTLIGPDLVLTAAHCVSPSVMGYSSQQQLTSDTVVILDTASVYDSTGRQISAANTIPHPSFNLNALGDNDIGLIRLSQRVTDRTPTPINRVSADSPVGVTVTQVGYGVSQVNNQNSAGRLYVLANKTSVSCSTLGESDINLLCFSQTDGTGKCEGDSGGPSFADIGGTRKVVGVTSFGDPNCTYYGADTRVDAETSFLDQNAPELQCEADGVCIEECGTGALPTDPDCPTCTVSDDCGDPNKECVDGFCQPLPFTPGGTGYACTDSAQCELGWCAPGPEGSRCTEGCTPEAADTGCPDDFDCLPSGDSGACWPTGPGGGGGGGCSVGAGDGSDTGRGTWVGLLLLAGLITLRRRRSRVA